MSSGQPSRGLFTLGGTGAIILAIASAIMAIAGFFPVLLSSYSFILYLTIIAGLVLLLISSIFIGIAYYAFYRHFSQPMGMACLVFGVIFSVALFAFAAIGTFPLFPSSFGLVLYWLGLLLYGTLLVIWGVSNIVIRTSTSMPGLFLASGIVLIVAGCFVASFLLNFIGFVLLLAAQIMNAIVFLKMAVF